MPFRALVLAGTVVHLTMFFAAQALDVAGLQRVLLEPLGTVLRLLVPPAVEASLYRFSMLLLIATSLLWGAVAASTWVALRRLWHPASGAQQLEG